MRCADHSPVPVLAQVYVWGRRHPYVHLNFLGLFNFTAPYLPWVLLAFSVTLRSNAVVDLLGIVAGVRLSPFECHCTEELYQQVTPLLESLDNVYATARLLQPASLSLSCTHVFGHATL